MNRPRRTGSGQPQLVGDIVGKLIDRRGFGAGIEAASVLTRWAELVGPQIASVTEAQRVSDGVLVVAVRSSAWIMELNLRKQELMKRLNAGKGEGRIRQIIFVMAG